MNKIIGTKKISGSEYFKNMLSEKHYTAETFTYTYNEIYPDQQISMATVQSLSCGRRSFAHMATITVLRIAQILDYPDCTESDYGYGKIVYHLVFGSEIIIYDPVQ